MWPFRQRKGLRDGADANSPSTAALGARGEKLAKKFLRRNGWKILAANYRCPVGEADLIGLDRREQTIVFVEVKTRSSDRNVAPESAVNAAKQARLRKIARYYLATRNTADMPVRFDVISIVIPYDGKKSPDIRHIPDAF